MKLSRDLQLTGTFAPIGSLDTLERKWRALEPYTRCSFFLSWSWIGAWLRALSDHEGLQVYECREHDDLIAFAVVSYSRIRRRKIIDSRMVSLNEVNQPDLNMFIEYNGLLARTGYEARAMQQLSVDLARCDTSWDEFQLTNIPQCLWNSLRPVSAKGCLSLDEEHATWTAPLAGVTTLEDLLSRLTSSRRSKIRRSFKEYEKRGELRVEAASSIDEALEYFHELGVLHTARWNRVGSPGSFVQPRWRAFHEDLIASALPRGEIQILRIRCGMRAIGYLYNFLWHNSVLMLQSGFVSENSNVLRPGYISHLLAMQFNAHLGAAYYDFLIGDSDYKRVLATRGEPLVSGRIQRKRLKFVIEDALVKAYRSVRRLRSRNNLD